MKRLFSFSLFLALVTTGNAQITIGQSEMPYAGDELNRTKANPNPFLNYGATGAGHTWNFSNLTAAEQDVTAYQSVGSTNIVYSLVYADVFFNSNRANHATEGVDIPFYTALPIENPYTFLYRSSSTYKKVGFGAELSGIPLPIIFNQHDVIYQLPLNYGNTSSSFSSWQMSIPTLAHYGYQQTRTNQVDGWGSITTPSGTYDALRVKTTLVGRDTINVDTLGLGFTIDRPTVREYKWLAEDIRVPVLQITTTELFGAEIITDVYFYDLPRTISIAPPFTQVLCPGSSLSVPYVVTGTFNPGGFLSQANIFRAQLSDANGSFATPTTIGSATGTQSGTINATIPANIAMGTGYRIRVIATNPGFIGADNGYDLSIGYPPVAFAEATGATEFCAGGSVVLQAGPGSGLSYQWSLDGTTISGATAAGLEASTSGTYSVEVSNTCGADVSEALTVVVNATPEHTLAETTYNTCNYAPVNIAATNTFDQLSVVYQWFLNGSALNNANAIDLTTSAAGEYTLEVLNTATGCTFTTPVATLVNEVVDTPELSAAGSTTFCAGGSLLLSTTEVQGIGYAWFGDGEVIVGANGASLLVEHSGSYSVTATSATGCAATAESVSVTEAPLPDAPVISQTGSTLSTTAMGDLQWYLNGVALDGATSGSIEPEAYGAYTVTVSTDAGCTATSDEHLYLSTGISSNMVAAVNVYPNPNVGRFTFSAPDELIGGMWSITNATGQLVSNGTVQGTSSVLDIQAQGPGIYVLRLVKGEVTHTARVIME